MSDRCCIYALKSSFALHHLGLHPQNYFQLRRPKKIIHRKRLRDRPDLRGILPAWLLAHPLQILLQLVFYRGLLLQPRQPIVLALLGLILLEQILADLFTAEQPILMHLAVLHNGNQLLSLVRGGLAMIGLDWPVMTDIPLGSTVFLLDLVRVHLVEGLLWQTGLLHQGYLGDLVFL